MSRTRPHRDPSQTRTRVMSQSSQTRQANRRSLQSRWVTSNISPQWGRCQSLCNSLTPMWAWFPRFWTCYVYMGQPLFQECTPSPWHQRSGNLQANHSSRAANSAFLRFLTQAPLTMKVPLAAQPLTGPSENSPPIILSPRDGPIPVGQCRLGSRLL